MREKMGDKLNLDPAAALIPDVGLALPITRDHPITAITAIFRSVKLPGTTTL